MALTPVREVGWGETRERFEAQLASAFEVVVFSDSALLYDLIPACNPAYLA